MEPCQETARQRQSDYTRKKPWPRFDLDYN